MVCVDWFLVEISIWPIPFSFFCASLLLKSSGLESFTIAFCASERSDMTLTITTTLDTTDSHRESGKRGKLILNTNGFEIRNCSSVFLLSSSSLFLVVLFMNK